MPFCLIVFCLVHFFCHKREALLLDVLVIHRGSGGHSVAVKKLIDGGRFNKVCGVICL